MSYINKSPQLINSPNGKVDVVKLLLDENDNLAYSPAMIRWKGIFKMGNQWNITDWELGNIKNNKEGQNESVMHNLENIQPIILHVNPHFYDFFNEGAKKLK